MPCECMLGGPVCRFCVGATEKDSELKGKLMRMEERLARLEEIVEDLRVPRS